MKITANSLKVGMIILHKDKLWRVVKTQHTQPGKGGAYVQAELKGVEHPTKLNERFRSSESIEKATMNDVACSYLYKDGENYIFMDQTTFEQFSLSEDKIGKDEVKMLSENLEVTISFHEENPVSVTLPKTIEVEVEDTEVEIKGQTVTASYKPAQVTGGLKVMVPPHIAIGTKIIVNTEDLTYVGKVK